MHLGLLNDIAGLSLWYLQRVRGFGLYFILLFSELVQ